jgi:hypothetical protein
MRRSIISGKGTRPTYVKGLLDADMALCENLREKVYTATTHPSMYIFRINNYNGINITKIESIVFLIVKSEKPDQ